MGAAKLSCWEGSSSYRPSLFQKPDLGAHASVAPTFVQAPERLQDVTESCTAGLLRGDREERTVRTQFGKDYCCGCGGFLLRNNPQHIGMTM